MTSAAGAAPPPPPAPFGPTSSPRQLAWRRMELHGFLLFTVNIFNTAPAGFLKEIGFELRQGLA